MELSSDKMRLRVAILGAGLSGQSAYRLVCTQGHLGSLYDQAGGEAATDFNSACTAEYDIFILSPGFAATHPWRQIAVSSGKPCYSELGYAAQYWKGKLYGITGTNGKTTLTQLLTDAFCRDGKTAIAAGNIGYPLSAAVLSASNIVDGCAVCEISSFQAELTTGLALDGLLWSNFDQDHLDRYTTMSEYFSAKAQLLTCLKPDAPCLLGEQVKPWIKSFKGLVAQRFRFISDIPDFTELTEDCVYRKSPHSKNLALVGAFWQELGGSRAALLQAANCGQLAPHRLQIVATQAGITFWDDSKATNFNAAIAAIDALTGPIFWIGGGSSKGGDIHAFAQSLAGKIEAAFVYGSVRDELAAALTAVGQPVEVFSDFRAAVSAATQAAQQNAPAQVLLSPGFASFGQFRSYSERGKCYISKVLSLM